MIMKETPVNKIMENTLEKMRQMVDTSTIIGEPMVTGTTTLIPVSKVSYGFTSGGTDLPSKQNQKPQDFLQCGQELSTSAKQ